MCLCLQVWAFGFCRLVFMRMSKTLANPLRRPPGHLMGSRSQIRVTTQGRSHANVESGPSKRGKKALQHWSWWVRMWRSGCRSQLRPSGLPEGGRRLFLARGVKEMAQ